MVEKVGYDEDRDMVYIEFGVEDETAGDLYAMQKLLKLVADSILNIYDAAMDIVMKRTVHDYDIAYINDEIRYIHSRLNEVREIINKLTKKLGVTL